MARKGLWRMEQVSERVKEAACEALADCQNRSVDMEAYQRADSMQYEVPEGMLKTASGCEGKECWDLEKISVLPACRRIRMAAP